MPALNTMLSYRPGRIAQSSIAASLLHGIRLVIQIPMLLLLARYLQASNYGLFAGVSALAIALGNISSFGTGFLVLTESAKNSPDGGKLLSTAIRITLLTSALLLPLYLFFVEKLFKLDGEFYAYALIGVTEILIMPLGQLLYQRTRGVGRLILSQSYILLPPICRLSGLAICMLIIPDGTVYYYAHAHLLSSMVALLLIATLTKYNADWHFSNGTFSLRVVLRSIPFGIMRFMNQAPTLIDKPLALRLLSASDAGIYSIASRGLLIAITPAVAIITSGQPRLISHLQDNYHAAGRLIGSILLSSFAVGLLASAGIFFVAPFLVTYALGPSFASLQSWFPLFAGIAPFMAIRLAAGGVFVALERPNARVLIEGTSLCLILAFGLSLGGLYGMFGLIIALYISEAVGAIMMIAVLFPYLRLRS